MIPALSFVLFLAQQPPQGPPPEAVAIPFAILFGMMCCSGVMGLAMLGFWVWMLIDCVRREFPNPNEKTVWILVIALVGPLGALIYMVIGRNKGRLVQ